MEGLPFGSDPSDTQRSGGGDRKCCLQQNTCRCQWPCQKDLRSLVAELSGICVLEATAVVHERPFTSLNLIHTCSKIVMSAVTNVFIFVFFCKFLETVSAEREHTSSVQCDDVQR